MNIEQKEYNFAEFNIYYYRQNLITLTKKLMRKIWVVSVYPEKWSLHWSKVSGVGSYTKNLLTNMPIEIQNQIIVFSNQEWKTSQSYEEKNLKIESCWTRNSMKSDKEILKTLEKYPEIKYIHIHHEFNMFGKAKTIPIFLNLLRKLKKKNIKIIVTFHWIVDPKIINKDFWKVNSLPVPSSIAKTFFKIFYKISSRYIDKAIAHEKYFWQVLKQHYWFKESQVEVFEHWVEDLKFSISQSQARKSLWIGENKNVLLYFWFLAWYKWVELLLDWFEKLDPKKYHLIFSGWKPKRTWEDKSFNDWYEKIESRAKSMPWVTRIGFVPDEDIEKVYAASDVLMIPYLYMLAASGPMAIALGYNLPFLVSSVFSPVIENKSMIFEKSPDDLARSIEDFFKNKSYMQNYIREMRENRIWKNISKKTSLLYI